ncbi:hypothetical protein [Georgenia wangjunii]|uniref:hypothetical protein n=1 Tax=Georgenia wangjunii TaxID=3117730 RepID=UPI002F265D34
MARPRTPIGTHGDPYYEETNGGRQIAVVRFRDSNGRTRKIKAVGRSRTEALRRLKKKIADHEVAGVGEEDLTADSLFVELADAWLQSLDDAKRLAPSTRYRYERCGGLPQGQGPTCPVWVRLAGPSRLMAAGLSLLPPQRHVGGLAPRSCVPGRLATPAGSRLPALGIGRVGHRRIGRRRTDVAERGGLNPQFLASVNRSTDGPCCGRPSRSVRW